MRLELLYFGSTQDAIGTAQELREFADSVATVADVLSALEVEGENYRSAFSDPSRLRFALDQAFVGIDAPVADGAELGIFPPVTGG